MRKKKLKWVILILALIAIGIFSPIVWWYQSLGKPEVPVYFGVSFGGRTAAEAKLLIDKIKDYTNFFLVNSWDLSTNETALNEVCDYSAESGLSFMVFFDFISLHPDLVVYPWHRKWVTTAPERWGDKFLGIYIYDEPGGKQIDTGLYDEFDYDPRSKMYENVTSFSEAAEIFLKELPRGYSFHFLQNSNISKFVSDYALYWFDYLAGYDTVFVEIGWNHSTPTHIGLCRGAATVQQKDWGAIIVWKGRNLEADNEGIYKTGSEMLEDMLVAFETGAKYIIVFNYPTNPPGNPYGILTDDHFSAMQQFWSHIDQNPQKHGETKAQAVLVLPKDYGWGMRWPEDRIWGLWPADDLSSVIWEKTNTLIEKYGFQIDIVYDDPRFKLEYPKMYYWNSTIE